MHIRNVLCLSARHLAPREMKLVETGFADIDEITPTPSVTTRPDSVDVEPAADFEYSLLVAHCATLVACLRYARERGCEALRFDATIEPHGELPSFDWRPSARRRSPR